MSSVSGCTFVAVLVVCSVEVVDGVHRMELDLCEISFADPVGLRGGLGRRPRHDEQMLQDGTPYFW